MKYLINQFWFDFEVRRTLRDWVVKRWADAHLQPCKRIHIHAAEDERNAVFLYFVWVWSQYLFFSSSLLLSLQSLLIIALPCLSTPVLKPIRVLPLISPSVCDSFFCQQAQASVQPCDSQHWGGMDLFLKALFMTAQCDSMSPDGDCD